MATVTNGDGTVVKLGNGATVTTNTENGIVGPIGKSEIIPAPAFEIGTLQDQSSGSTGKVITILCGGSSDTDFQTFWTVPNDFLRLLGVDIIWMEDNISAAGNLVWKLALKKSVNLGPAVHASTDAETVVACVGTGDITHITPMALPNIVFSPGDIVPIRIERQASTDPSGLDTWAGGAGFQALRIRYLDR